MVPHLGKLIDGSVLRDFSTPIYYFLNSGVLGLERSPAHVICYLVEFMRDVTKSYRPS